MTFGDAEDGGAITTVAKVTDMGFDIGVRLYDVVKRCTPATTAAPGA